MITNDANLDNEENILSEQKESNIFKEEAYRQLEELRMSSMEKFQEKYNAWPMKAPVYVRNALIEGKK